jgi:DnaK suppressor protein
LQNSKDLERRTEELNFSNEIDLASSLESREMAFTLSSRDRSELKLIDEAIFRIDNRSYGMCVDCPRGNPSQFIGLKRLEILPLTTLCVECQEFLEKS